MYLLQHNSGMVDRLASLTCTVIVPCLGAGGLPTLGAEDMHARNRRLMLTLRLLSTSDRHLGTLLPAYVYAAFWPLIWVFTDKLLHTRNRRLGDGCELLGCSFQWLFSEMFQRVATFPWHFPKDSHFPSGSSLELSTRFSAARSNGLTCELTSFL